LSGIFPFGIEIAYLQEYSVTRPEENKMNRFGIRALALAACLAALALPASAEWLESPNDTFTATGPLGQTWTASWSGWNAYERGSNVWIHGDELVYDFTTPFRGAWAGTPTQTYVFTTTARRSGLLDLKVMLASNEPWDGSATSMYIWHGGLENRELLAGNTSDSGLLRDFVLNLSAGEQWGFMAVSGSIGDNSAYTGPLHGIFGVTYHDSGNQVPEPASLAIMGLGVLGIAAARRKKA
jgi:hypothetical protein